MTVAVFAVWIGMVVVLVRRQAPPASTPLSELAELPAPSAAGTADEREEWFGIRRGDHKVGWARRTTERVDDGWRFRDDSSFTLAMLGVPQTIRTALDARTDGAYALRSFDFTLLSPATRFHASGTTDGRTLRLRYGPEGTEQTTEIPLAEPIQLPTPLRLRVLKSHPKPGERFVANVFSPLTLRNEPLALVVEGSETIPGPGGSVETTRISEENQGMRAKAWLDADGSVIREEGTLGFTLERATADTALAGIEREAPLDITLTSRIPLTGEIANPREASELVLKVGGAAMGRVPDDPPRQRVQGDRLHITREQLPADLPAGLPPPGSTGAGVAEYLDPSPFIESDDPAIVGTARAIVGDERDPVRIAQSLVDWVGDHLVQEPTMSVPSARAVLATRRGDCNEHAVLLTALARAAGIPSRVAAGAMYADGAFLYHAWSEFWLGRWVSADAVFRQMPTDVTHVKLIEGGPERHMALGEMIGQLELSVEGGGS